MTPNDLLASTNNIIALLQNASTGSATDVAARQQQRTPLARGAGPVGAPALNSYDYNRFYQPTIEPIVAQLEQAGRAYALNQALNDALKQAANNYRSAYTSAASKASGTSASTTGNAATGQVHIDTGFGGVQFSPTPQNDANSLLIGPFGLPGVRVDQRGN